jgi:protein-disulfide isomerase
MARGWTVVAGLVLLNSVATLLVGIRVREIGDFLIWFALPEAAETPPATGQGSSSGLEGVRVEIYFDPTCPVCVESASALLAVRKEDTGGAVGWDVIPVAPPPFMDNTAFSVGLAFVCAKEQNAEWDVIDATQNVGVLDTPSIGRLVVESGGDEHTFNKCLRGGASERMLWQNRFTAAGLGIRGTPAVVVGGVVVEGLISHDGLSDLIHSVVGQVGEGDGA